MFGVGTRGQSFLSPKSQSLTPKSFLFLNSSLPFPSESPVSIFRFFFVFPYCLSFFSVHTMQRIEASDTGRGRGCGWVD